jgi:hypothetical protein
MKEYKDAILYQIAGKMQIFLPFCYLFREKSVILHAEL